MTLANAIKQINKKGMLLVFPQQNRKEPPSLWYEFFPRTKMRWEWDEGGDSRVSDLWFLREKLSISRRVVYSKWFRDKATLMSFNLFTALIRLSNPNLPEISGLSFAAREILDLLEEDSPLSTKQVKRMADMQGRDSESAYRRAMKELWSRQLIVAFGEVDEGAFPSLAMGATKVIFEEVWANAQQMKMDEAEEIVARLLPEGSSFMKYWKSLQNKWNEPRITDETEIEF